MAPSAASPRNRRTSLIAFVFRLAAARSVSLSINATKDHMARVLITPSTLRVQKDDHDHEGPDRAVVFLNAAQSFEAGTWHRVVLEMVGDTMVATIDGKVSVLRQRRPLQDREGQPRLHLLRPVGHLPQLHALERQARTQGFMEGNQRQDRRGHGRRPEARRSGGRRQGQRQGEGQSRQISPRRLILTRRESSPRLHQGRLATKFEPPLFMNEPFDTIEEALADIAAGKLVIVTDDENRENEGDLVMAASKATPRRST
jgi:hypothetical protein